MGGVYLAESSVTGEQVALKVLEPQFAFAPEVVARLLAEHALAARTSHPGVVQIQAARETPDGMPYLVMEYLDGETLQQKHDKGPLEISAIIELVAQAAAALAALHAVGVIHCDVKHDNVFVCADGRVKVIDLGVARTTDEVFNPDEQICGTPWCMAPEQWRGRPELKSDVYSLGCMLYELTTGGQPFSGSLPALMLAHLEERPARPSWLRTMPLALERIILRAMAKDPAMRPTMNEIACDLAELADDVANCLSTTMPMAMRRAG
jgi:serine/threonine-protein kinase